LSTRYEKVAFWKRKKKAKELEGERREAVGTGRGEKTFERKKSWNFQWGPRRKMKSLTVVQ